MWSIPNDFQGIYWSSQLKKWSLLLKKKKKESLFPLSQGLLVHINKDKAEFTSLS